MNSEQITNLVEEILKYGQAITDKEFARLGSQWFASKSGDGLAIYVRVNAEAIHKSVRDSQYPVMVLSNINCIPTGQGIFTEFLDKLLEATNRKYSIEVENVLTERFDTFLRKRGFVDVDLSSYTNSVWPSSLILRR